MQLPCKHNANTSKFNANTMQIQCKYNANTMQESHAATSAICKYICKPQLLHAFAYASPCKPTASIMQMHETGTKSLPVLPNVKKDESRLLEVVGSIPSMCLHVSVLCLDAWQHLNLLVHRACIYASTMHLHMQARCKKLMQRFQRYASTYARYLHCICIVFAWYFLVFALYLHCICIVFALCLHGAACICKSHASPRNTLCAVPAGARCR